MICTAWGMYPKIRCRRFTFDKEDILQKIIKEQDSIIPYGNGRSYGDSALSPNIIDVRQRDHFVSFNEEEGLLHVQAGVLLSEILEHFVPRGWFLKVTPGTKLITVGGAIASDVHGKNHHVVGCFSECVREFRIMLPEGEVVTCTRDGTPELWKATCGGQGLTGVILDAKIYLERVNSQYIDQTTIKTTNLKETFDAFEEYQDMPYSVAWIDCFATKDEVGKGLLMVGRFKDDGDLDYKPKTQKTIPFNFPGFVLNRWSAKAFNWLYYHRVSKEISVQSVDIDTFFYPLDAIGHWNRVYGKKGLIQYQFVLPKEASYEGLREILAAISTSKEGSFLGVLKLCGESNNNWLSFPMEGYSLALDFKADRKVFELLKKLDSIVVSHGGRMYLTKDARVSREVFEQGYPNIERFRRFRKENRMDKKFQSLQSQRVGI